MSCQSRSTLATTVFAILAVAPVTTIQATPDQITLTLDQGTVPEGVGCGDTWTESGVELKLLSSALTDCNGGACLFLSQVEQLFLIARLHVDLNGVPGTVTAVEIDVMGVCAQCSFASLYDGDTVVDSVGVASGVETLELNTGGLHVDRLALDTCFDFFVREIRITFDRQPVDAGPSNPATRTRLLTARPNPFNPSTTIPFALERSGLAEVRVYDLAGRLVRRLLRAEMPPGVHVTGWNGLDQRGQAVPSGVYIFQLQLDGEVVGTQKGMLLK